MNEYIHLPQNQKWTSTSPDHYRADSLLTNIITDFMSNTNFLNM